MNHEALGSLLGGIAATFPDDVPGQLNERYLHHQLSHDLQARHGIVLLHQASVEPQRLHLHCEWPTYKEATGIDGGRYLRAGTAYRTAGADGTGGSIDFAIGPYGTPRFGIELKLKRTWDREGMAFDLMKLLDGRNPFEVGFSLYVLVRENELAGSGRLMNSMRWVARQVATRLGEDLCSNRRLWATVVEVPPVGIRRFFHLTNRGFVSGPALPGGATGAWASLASL